MKIKYSTILICTGFILLTVGCNKGPKVITAKETSTEESTGIFSAEDSHTHIQDQPQPAFEEDMHSVVILEVLPTVRYVYLRVKEGPEEFWIATNKLEVTVGKTYFYRGGLLKTNFESKEHKRVFDRMYLVSSIVEADHGNTNTTVKSEPSGATISNEIVSVKGSVKIADLVANPKKYDGKIIQISGKCVKINANIMGRHWVHLKDGSKDDFDLVITCNVAIPEGHTVTMTGKVALNKDFGSGYQYDILLEDGELVN
jgi:hypothetical protein